MMRIIKSVLLLLTCLQISICSAQQYAFIPSDQHLLSEAEMASVQIMITPDVLLFSERGEILPMSNMQLMTNPEYSPLFYADSENKIKSVVFIKKNKAPVLIEKNPEAEFELGEKALDFIVTDLKGTRIKLSELKGQVVVLNFWFTKCGPCILEMPQLNTLSEAYQGKNVVFLALTFNKKDMVEAFLETHSFNYTIAANANDVVSMYGVQSFPTSIVINQKGEIVLKELGYRTNIKEVLSASINSLLVD